MTKIALNLRQFVFSQSESALSAFNNHTVRCSLDVFSPFARNETATYSIKKIKNILSHKPQQNKYLTSFSISSNVKIEKITTFE
ncbi:hypothetical protein AR687_02795 [Flavobacteriaceae bacterium CRH]|nr:hypothetical protein AR687_02795 [Flavobacteriaceae bacterium CRH]